ncbi:MAG: helix-turn-helix domain-containing protein [Thermoactinospora sp.]|nr:helix-turn-helix domain-containing protein [Thermoactinospora sp.]
MDPRPALNTDPHEVGARLRRMREARGISLSELARRAGVGKATLSGVENGSRNPTLETLWAITAQLGVPLAAVLDPPADPLQVYGKAAEATLLQVFDEGPVTFELYRLRVRPGITQRSPGHHAGVTEHITVFSGTLCAGPAQRPLTAGPGEFIKWTADSEHIYTTMGEEEVHATLLMRYPLVDGV